jgi:phospholipid N-methyltransferase
MQFFLEYLKHPKEVGSAIPSSRYLTRSVLNRIDWSQARNVVELGSGTGIITKGLLNKLSHLTQAQLTAFEINTAYAHTLRAITNPILHIEEHSAWDIEKIVPRRSADVVISGIPLSNFSRDEVRTLMQSIHSTLRPGGLFIQYQFIPRRLKDVRSLFPEVHITWEVRNVPPACVFSARRSK